MTATAEYRDLLAPHCSGGALDRLVLYAELLERWSARHSLVRFAGRAELVERHLVDALAAVQYMGPGGRLADIGSGAGLPGIPLLAAADGWTGVLVEPRQKRWAFIRLAIRELGLAADAECARYQDLQGLGECDLITMRAVAERREVLAWGRPRLSDSGWVYFWITTGAMEELRNLDGWRVLSSPLPGLEKGRLARLQPCFT